MLRITHSVWHKKVAPRLVANTLNLTWDDNDFGIRQVKGRPFGFDRGHCDCDQGRRTFRAGRYITPG